MAGGDAGTLILVLTGADGPRPEKIQLRAAEFDADENLTVQPVWFELKDKGLFVWNGYEQYKFFPMHRIIRMEWER